MTLLEFTTTDAEPVFIRPDAVVALTPMTFTDARGNRSPSTCVFIANGDPFYVVGAPSVIAAAIGHRVAA